MKKISKNSMARTSGLKSFTISMKRENCVYSSGKIRILGYIPQGVKNRPFSEISLLGQFLSNFGKVLRVLFYIIKNYIFKISKK